MTNSVLAKLDNGQFQLSLTISKDKVEKSYKHVLAQASERIEVPGFRKGKAPKAKVEEKIDKNKIYEEVLRELLPVTYAQAINEHKLKPVLDPRFELISAEDDSDWQIRATCAEMPEIDLGDYKKGLKGLLKTVKIWTPDSAKQNSAKQIEEENVKDDNADPELLKQKQAQKITEWLLSNVKVEPPEIMMTEQANILLARLLDQIQKLGLNLEQYLASTNKKLEDLKADYAKRAKEEIRLELIVSEIGRTEKVSVDDSEINKLIDETQDKNMSETMKKPEYVKQLKNIIYRQKILDLLMRIAN